MHATSGVWAGRTPVGNAQSPGSRPHSLASPSTSGCWPPPCSHPCTPHPPAHRVERGSPKALCSEFCLLTLPFYPLKLCTCGSLCLGFLSSLVTLGDSDSPFPSPRTSWLWEDSPQTRSAPWTDLQAPPRTALQLATLASSRDCWFLEGGVTT